MHKVTFTLLIIGGLNWLLEAFNYGVIAYLPEMVSKIIYVLIGLSAVYELVMHKKSCKGCAPNMAAPKQ